MKITIIGRGGVGGGLARLWETAGHEVTALGRDGGDAGDSDLVVIAVHSDVIGEAISNVEGVSGKIVVDVTNPLHGRADGFESLAAQVKSLTNGPVAKALNTNFERLYDEAGRAQQRPSSIYCSDDDAREAAEQVIRDAGYEPVHAGGLENARALEDFVTGVMLPIVMSGRGQFFYRIGGPDEM